MKIKSNIKKVKECLKLLTAEIDAADVESRFQHSFREISKQAKVPGFRQGKAPIDVIEKRYYDVAREEVMKDLLAEAYSELVRKHEIQPVSYPRFKEVSLDRGKPLKFVAESECAPQIKIKKTNGYKIRRPSSEVKEEDILKTLESFGESHATTKPLQVERAAAIGDMVRFEIEVFKSGQSTGPKRQSSAIIPKTSEGDASAFFAAVTGMKAGESKDITMPDGSHWHVEIKEILEREFPPMDDEFAKKFGKQTLEELKEEVRKDMSSYFRSRSQQTMREQLYEKLIEDHRFEVPPSYVERQKHKILEHTLQRSGLDAKAFASLPEAERGSLDKTANEQAEKQVRLYFLLDAMALEMKVSAEEADIERRVQEVSTQTGMSPEEVRQKYLDDIRHELRQDKLVDQLLASANIVDEERKDIPKT